MTQMYTKEQLFMAIELAQSIQYYDIDKGSAIFDYSIAEIIEKITPPTATKAIEDLSDCFNDKFQLNDKNLTKVLKYRLMDEIRENTPHGEEGVNSHNNYYTINGTKIFAEISDVRWDRHDKQYYFIDTYHTPTVEWEIID